MAYMTQGRRDQILAILHQSNAPLDDDEIAHIARMNRVYVNTQCRQLAADGMILRRQGAGGKIVNAVAGLSADASQANHAEHAVPIMRTRKQSLAGQADRIRALVAGFSGYVTAFESRLAFPGPSLYFHQRAIELRRTHQSASSLLADTRFLEYVYAVLPAWGMHRMGPQAAKVGDFAQITTALADKAAALERLWPLRITSMDAGTSREVAATAWDIIAHIKVSTSRTQIVAGSKFLHHLLPDLVPPIDRQYTFMFFTGHTMVASDRDAFADWYPKLADIGRQCRKPIREATSRGGLMATGEAKVIDNAIIGYMQARRGGSDAESG